MEGHVEYALLNLPLESSHSQLDITNGIEATDPRMQHVEKKQSNVWTGTIIVFLLILVILLSCTVGVLAFQIQFGNGTKALNAEFGKNDSLLSVRDELCIRVPDATNEQRNECKLCPVDWKIFQENCYFISANDQIKNWKESQAFCSEMNSHLMVLENQEQMNFLGQMDAKDASYWIGLYFDTSIQNWTWVTCESCKNFQLTFKITSEENHCVLGSTRYNSENCKSPNNWICQKKAIRL
ncbi:natural killer cells antigen CD94-like isoform X1 [Ranitomeya imitator]|uniref:natural killer cells antigen CD94-like isoform X1 n=2 Tax=Ranitomeya imitator TaxID=111125 RepID=UPI0037E91955